MTLKSPTDMVIYRSRLNAKINRNFDEKLIRHLGALARPSSPPARSGRSRALYGGTL